MTINSNYYDFSNESLIEILGKLGYNYKRVTIEVNGKILDYNDIFNIKLNESDSIVIVPYMCSCN